MADYERQYNLMSALMAPVAGLAVVSGLVVLLFGPEQRVLTGLFYVLMVGTPIAYGLEFLALWYFRERMKGGQLDLPRTILVSGFLGFMTPVVPIYGFDLVQPTVSWLLIGGLGIVGGVTSALTFRFLAPTARPSK